MARRIDDVDPVVAPETGGRRRSNRDPALLFLDHPVHRRGTVMHFTDLIIDAGVVEDPLRSRGLTGINVSHDADIAGFL